MRKEVFGVILLVLLAGVFVVGSFYSEKNVRLGPNEEGRRGMETNLDKVAIKEIPKAELFDSVSKLERMNYIMENGQMTTKTGFLETIIIDDFENNRSWNEYSIREDNGKKSKVYFFDEPSLISGVEVRIEGTELEDEIAVIGFDIISEPAMRDGEDLDSIGDQRTLVFLINFLDSGLPPFSPEEAHELVFNGQFQNFMREQSYSKVWFSGEVYGWITLPIWSGGACDSVDLDDIEIKNLILSHGINLTEYDHLLFVVYPNLGGCSSIGKINISFEGNNYFLSKSWISSSWFDYPYGDHFNWTQFDFVLAHEMGHALGVGHATGLDCGNTTLLFPYVDNCQYLGYGNRFDTMGAGIYSLHYNVAYKEFLGWLNSSSILTITQSGRYSLLPLESASGERVAAVIQRIGQDDRLHKKFYLEHRSPLGFDAALTNYSSNTEGLFVNFFGIPYYSWDIYSIPSLLDMSPTEADWTYDTQETTLNSNSSFNDPEYGITLENITLEDDELSFNVIFGPVVCLNRTPRIINYPDSNPIYRYTPGAMIYLNRLIQNEDSELCGPSDFELFVIMPTDWQVIFIDPQHPVSYLPGGLVKNVYFEMFIPPDTPLEEYLVTINVINTRTGTNASQTFNVSVVQPPYINQIVPSLGLPEDNIQIQGSGFADSFNYINFINLESEYYYVSSHLPSIDGQRIDFTIPSTICDYFGNCSIPTPNGVYELFVIANQAASNHVLFTIGFDEIRCNSGQIIGDINGDYNVTEIDYNLTGKIVSGVIPAPVDICCVDANFDCRLSIADWVKVGRIAAGLDPIQGTCHDVISTYSCGSGQIVGDIDFNGVIDINDVTGIASLWSRGGNCQINETDGNCCVDVNHDEIFNYTDVEIISYDWQHGENYSYGYCGGLSEICNDGIDNDGDSLIDCLDSDCEGEQSCCTYAPIGSCVRCPDLNGDGIVNISEDGQGDFVQCIYWGNESACRPEFDLNGDGLYTTIGDVPCLSGFDGNLSSDLSTCCQEENCTLLGDEDDDGLADCLDSDCDGQYCDSEHTKQCAGGQCVSSVIGCSEQGGTCIPFACGNASLPYECETEEFCCKIISCSSVGGYCDAEGCSPELYVAEGQADCYSQGNGVCCVCLGEGRFTSEPEQCCEELEAIPAIAQPGIFLCTANCGDGVCDRTTESNDNCPEDCSITQPKIPGMPRDEAAVRLSPAVSAWESIKDWVKNFFDRNF